MFFPKRKKVTKTCPACGKTFEGDRQRVTCSNACRQSFYRKRKQPRRAVEIIVRLP